VLDLGLEPAEPGKKGADGGPLLITASRMDCLPGALGRAYPVLGLDGAAAGDEFDIAALQQARRGGVARPREARRGRRS
jgi:hypothetical protein